jgi:hypothetical protein
MTPSALTGSLRDLPLHELLTFLQRGRRTGVVRFDGAVRGVIALHDGLVTLALAEDGPSLQQVLVGSGIASNEGWHQAQLAATRGVPLADALLRRGADTERLKAVLREQTVGALFEFVIPSDTEFSFVPDATHPLGHRFVFDPLDLLDEADERVAAWRQIAEAIPSTSMVMRLCLEAPADVIEVSADDWRVLARVDGHRTIAELIRSLGMSAFAVCAVLHRLLLARIVEPVAAEYG